MNGVSVFLRIDFCFFRLRYLQAAFYAVQFSVFDKFRARLLEVKENSRINALLSDIKDPIVIAYPCLASAFAAAYNKRNAAIQIFPHIDRTEKRLAGDVFVLCVNGIENREAGITFLLVFDSAGESNVIPAAVPVGGFAFFKANDAFGDYCEFQIIARSYHIPTFASPKIRFRKKKIGGHTGIDTSAGRDFIFAGARFTYRQIKIFVFLYLGRILFERCVSAVNVAVAASLGIFNTSVPRIPNNIHSV